MLTAREKVTTRRASNEGYLSMTFDQHLKLLDWASREIRRRKVGVIPKECASILERLDCTAETWLDFVKNFRNQAVACRRVANRSAPLIASRGHF
ncbi:MAG: hypothetical protein NT138_26160 [Planctomycetales bacterium]|nr:hypothetical protein [Planctomycetales bacterium]